MTYDLGIRDATGIDLVLVNGAIAAEGGRTTDVRAGRFLHFNQ